MVTARPVLLTSHCELLTLCEVHGAGDSHMLRVCLYDPKSSRSVEYRISPLERLLLSNARRPLIEQVKSRVKLVTVDSLNTLYSPLLI